MIGKREGSDFEVVDVIKASNMANSSTRFEINPEELYRAIKGAEAKSLEVIGFYHSHLGYGAGPSGYVTGLRCLAGPRSPRAAPHR